MHAFARDYPELLHRIADCLAPPDVAALADACTHARTLRTHSACVHMRVIAPSLRAIRRIDYHVGKRYYRGWYDGYVICTGDISMRDSVSYWRYDTIISASVTENLRIFNSITHVLTWISTVRGHVEWCTYTECSAFSHWTEQRLRLYDVVEHCHMCLFNMLTPQDVITLTTVCRALRWRGYDIMRNATNYA